MTVHQDPNAVLVLFAGAADGWGVGLQRAGYRIVALAESDPERRAVLRKRHPEAVIYEDVRDVTAERLVRDLGYLPGVVVGSPPCQDISCANNGKAQGVDGDRSGLYFEAIRIIGEVRPDWYALENSAFVKTRGYDRLHAALGAVGYACWPSVVGAVHAGFFHLRKRSWLAGVDVSYAQEEPLGRARQPRAGASDAAHAHADGQLEPEGVVGEIGRRAGHGDPRLAADADTNEGGCEGLPGPDARRRAAEAAFELPAHLGALEEAGRRLGLGGRSQLGVHYRVAHGFRAGLVAEGLAAGLDLRRAVKRWTDRARSVIAAYGDALVPDIAEAFGHVMPQLLAELRASRAA